MTSAAEVLDPRLGERNARSNHGKRFKAGEQILRVIQGLAVELTCRSIHVLTAASESWDDDFVFRPAERSSSSRSSPSTLPGDFSPTSTSTTSRRPFDQATAHHALDSHETQVPLSATRTARRRESKCSRASTDWTASPDRDAMIKPLRRAASESATDVHAAPSSTKTRRLQPCSSRKLTSPIPCSTPSPCPAFTDAEAQPSATPSLMADGFTGLATCESDLADESDGEVAVASLKVESKSRPASPLQRFGTRHSKAYRVDGSSSTESNARLASVEAILADDKSSRSQVPFAPKESNPAGHASRTESTQLEGLGADLSPPSSSSRKRKLVKKRPPEQQQPVPASLSALALATDGTSDPSVFSNSSGGSTRTVSGWGPQSERPPVDPTRSEQSLGAPTRPSLPLPTICTPRTRSVTTPAQPDGTTAMGERDWIRVESFPAPVPASPPFAAPDRQPSWGLLHDRSVSETNSAAPTPSVRDAEPRGSQHAAPSNGFGSGRLARFLGRSVSGPASEHGSRVPSAAPTVERERTSLFRRSSRKLKPELHEPKFSISRSNSWSRSIGRTRFSFDRHGRSSPPPVPPVPALEQLPHSAIALLAKSRRSSHRPERPPGLADLTETNVSSPPLPSLSVPMRPDQTGSTARGSNEIESATTRSRPRRVSHRPSVSLPSVPSFVMAFHTSEQSVTPQMATISNNTAKRMQASEAEPPVASDSMRPQKLSDLRIPLQVAATQKKIQDDLDRVKQFAVAIKGESGFLCRQPRTDNTSLPELKALRIHFDAIKSNLSAPALCWEQAQALIDLADGDLIKEPEASAGARSPSQNDGRTHSTSRSRASSPESTASTAVRQRETLRRVFAASEVQKRAWLPARAPPVLRPTLKVLSDQQSVPCLAGAALSAPKGSLASSPGRQTSFRLWRLIFRLRSEPTRDIAVEPSSLDRSTPSVTSTNPGRAAESSRDSDGEDWDREFGFSGSVAPDESQQFDLDGKMILTSQRIPRLLAKATELRQACLRELALSQT